MKHFSSRLDIVFVFIFLFAGPASAAEHPPMVFTHLSIEDGLSQATVNATLQDSQGFLWLATENGLNRYDGNEIKRYYQERDKVDGLASDFIRTMEEDESGNLWIATDGGGLAVWDRLTDTFKSYRHNPGDPTSLASDNIRDVLIDRSGNVWAATRGEGLDRLNPVTGEMTHFVHDAAVQGSLSSNLQLMALMEDHDGNIWVGTSAGLDKYNADSNRFEHYAPPPATDDSHSFLAITQDHTGTIWLGSFDEGLLRFDPATGQFTAYVHSPDDPASLSNNQIAAIFEDSAKRLWIGSSGGLGLLDRDSGTFQNYARDRTNPSSLPSNFVRSISEDRNGLLWVGSGNSGVSRWNPRSWLLGHKIPHWLPEPSMINSFAEFGGGELWIGTEIGLQRMERDGLVTTVADREVLGDNSVMTLLGDRDKQLWIGTMSGGLFLRRTDGSISSFSDLVGSENAPAVGGIMSLFEDSRGRIWIGTFGGGVYVYEPETGAVRRYVDETGQSSWLERARAAAIREDHQGRIWVGTYGDGLLVLDYQLGLLHQFKDDPQQRGSLASSAAFSLLVDSRGTLWIGTSGGGLDSVVDMAADFPDIRFQNLSQANGLSNNVIYAIGEDNSGALWFSSNRGLMRLNPKTRLARSFHASHGAQDEEYSAGAFLQSSTGNLLFAGVNGYNDFNPLLFTENRVPPPVVITQIEVQNKPLSSDVAIPMLDKLELDYHENAISLEFAALNYTSPERNKFAYRLSGFDEDWVSLRDEHRVSYTNLSAGKYLFQVKAAVAGSVWSEEGVQLAITVRPAPWQTWWAYVIYAILALLLVVLVYRLQTRRLREQQKYARLLAHEVKTRTNELNQRNIELAEASAAKSDFLARMSHEIRTPMNGVMGMSDLLSATKLDSQQKLYTQTISRSAQTLLQIINDILDLSKIEAGRVELGAQPFEVEQMIDECLALMTPQAKDKGVALLAEVDSKIPKVLIGDALRIHQVLINLLSNALKFTADGQVLLRANLKQSKDEHLIVRMEVADTGIGIDQHALEGVFDAFSQVDETNTRRFGGTGLGLSICKQLVELMGGQIGVSSELDVGSTFWCDFPLTVPEVAILPAGERNEVLSETEAQPGQAAEVCASILVVEDNMVNQIVAEGTLAQLGYEVGMASEGRAAIDLLATQHFDLVLMDCQMPGMDGFEATRLIREAESGGKHIPIVGLTAHASADARDACLEAGMDDFISKPYTTSELAPVLVRWLA